MPVLILKVNLSAKDDINCFPYHEPAILDRGTLERYRGTFFDIEEIGTHEMIVPALLVGRKV